MDRVQLSVEMMSALALMASWMAFLVYGFAAAFFTGLIDIYDAVPSLLGLEFPYLVCFYFGLRRKGWAYLGSSLFSVLVIVLVIIPFGIDSGTTNVPLWETMFGTLLSALVAVAGLKGYLQCRSSGPS